MDTNPQGNTSRLFAPKGRNPEIDKDILNIATCNIEGIKSNTVYLQSLQHENTVICIQEHFLWDFEKNCLQSVMPTLSYHIRWHDYLEPLSGFKLPRGRGGVAILWPKVWSSKVKRLDEGNERIVVITIAASKPICFINAYLPTQDSGSHTEYLECLDILHSIFMKYQGTYQAILCGDLNGTLLETRSNKRDKLLRNFVTELHLSTGISCGTIPTFHHHAGTSSSQIDYILVQNRQIVSSYNILDKSPICSSAHVTVLAKMNITLPYAS